MVAHRFLEPKVLITTSVLDNGISLEDSSLRNIAIISNSRLSFIQMLGRIRECDGVDTINLILLKREATELSVFLTRYENLVKQIDIIINNHRGICGLSYKEIIRRSSKDIFRIFQRMLYAFIYKANKQQLLRSLER